VLKDPVSLTVELAPIQRAFANPHLASLTALAAPAFQARLFWHDLTLFGGLGVTYEWNGNLQKLLPSTRTGTPVGSARVILYVIDSATGQPASPANEIGHADLIPNPTGSPVHQGSAFRFVVTDTRSTPRVVADWYAVADADVLLCRCYALAGWVDDGVTRIDFAGEYSPVFSISTEAFAIYGTFNNASPAFEFVHTGGLRNPYDSLDGGGVRLLRHGDDVVASTAVSRGTARTITAPSRVRINGVIFAERLVAGQRLAGPFGRELTAVEQVAVESMFALGRSILLAIDYPMLLLYR
jgi:hypothetical protein